MRVSDVVQVSKFQIKVRASGADGALHCPISWIVPSEWIDPTEYLTPRTLVLTSGLGMNVTDYRVWDAYVERLVKVPIAALVFGLGPGHQTVPKGLISACKDHGLPLLLVPPEVSLALVYRDVQHGLNAARYENIRRGSELAQQCTQLVARGGTLQDLLNYVSSSVGARLTIEDRTGAELLRAGEPGPIIERTEFTLPAPDSDAFRLVLETTTNSQSVATLVQPATAVLAMHLTAMLGSTATTHSRSAGRLVEAIYSRSAVRTEELINLTEKAEIDPYRPIGVVVLEVKEGLSVTYLRTMSWRVRSRLAAEYPILRFVEDADLSTILVHGPMINASALYSTVNESLADAASISCQTDVVENAAELGLILRHLRRRLEKPGVYMAPRMDFGAVVDTLQHPGTTSLARRVLQPIALPEHEPLRETLEAYLQHSGATAAVCEQLFIHRNTLAYRLQKLEALLDMDLQDGQTRAILLLSLRLV